VALEVTKTHLADQVDLAEAVEKEQDLGEAEAKVATETQVHKAAEAGRGLAEAAVKTVVEVLTPTVVLH
jgi:hypothetical protein